MPPEVIKKLQSLRWRYNTRGIEGSASMPLLNPATTAGKDTFFII